MHVSGDKFLARTSFTGDQHVCSARSDQMDSLQEGL